MADSVMLIGIYCISISARPRNSLRRAASISRASASASHQIECEATPTHYFSNLKRVRSKCIVQYSTVPSGIIEFARVRCVPLRIRMHEYETCAHRKSSTLLKRIREERERREEREEKRATISGALRCLSGCDLLSGEEARVQNLFL